MTSSSLCLFFSSFLLSILSLSLAKPHALLLPVQKDQATLQYVTRINTRIPLVPLKLVVDLGGRYLWVDCDSDYVSSSYRPVNCHTPECNLQQPVEGCTDCNMVHRPGCNKNACNGMPESPTFGTFGELAQDVFAFQSTDGYNPGPVVNTSNFIFSCAPRHLLKGLAQGASGMAGLARNRIALPIQLAVEFRLRPKFAICLSPSTSSDGVIFFGEIPYSFIPSVQGSLFMVTTPLITNNYSTAKSYTLGERSVDHFIRVTSIKVNGRVVPVNKELLKIDRLGIGGTKISTTAPYTLLETSIYKAVTVAFDTAMNKSNIERVASVAPFKLCYSAAGIRSTNTGPAVPTIDFVLHSDNIRWRIWGANSMVEAKEGVLCLGFVNGGVKMRTPFDGGVKSRTSIVIGGHQIEDTLVQFDLKQRMLGFNSLRVWGSTCANFNFTANP
ncbi:uncharacterized protein A4U43_C03F2680 [Asparagus officinalis]|nr:uncharacterized protein A4U43_C03F2680 [Asparagus officinalis]